jgi:uncharacterized protein DUF6754
MPELSSLVSVGLIILAVLLLGVFTFFVRNGFKPPLRQIPGYEALARLVGQAVESGGRVHVSVGSGGLIGEDTSTTLTGLALLEYVSKSSSISDLSPLGTTGNATTLPVLTDTIRRAYVQNDLADKFETTAARVIAFDPLAQAGGTTAIIVDDDVRANVLVGVLGPEVTLMAEAGQRRRIPQVMGSDRVHGQAVAYVMADHPLIGEEIYASRGYLTQEPTAVASLATQDVLRWLIIGAIVGGSILGIFKLIP